MSERIENLEYVAPKTTTLAEGRESPLFITGPGEFLCARIADVLALDPAWKAIFGDQIDAYQRGDYAIRNLPALRIYCEGSHKDHETWYLMGALALEVIWPPAIRRQEAVQLPSQVSAALLQQFRRTSFFNAVAAATPGLNELGKAFDIDNSLVYQLEDDQYAPVTRMLANFRINLNEWDEYAESDDRTRDDPFTRPLGNLQEIVTTINALRDDGTVGATVGIDQTTGG